MKFKRLKGLRILRRQSVSEAAIILVVITFLSKIIGYLRTVLVAYYFGATAQVDAFVVAMLIPSMVLGIIAGGLQTVIIPVYTEKRHEDVHRAKVFVNQIFAMNLIILAAISVLMFLFPTTFVKIVAYGFKGQRLTLASYFMRFLIVYGFLNVFLGFFRGIFQAEKQFLFPAVVTLVANMLIPLSLFSLAPRIGINSWTVGEISFGIFGFSVMFLFLFYKKQFFHSFELFHIDWLEIRRFFYLLFPIILTSGVNALYQIVDKTVASSLPSGSVAALNFAQLVYIIPCGLIATPIGIAVYPTFSALAVEKNNAGYVEALRKSLSVLMFIMIPISIVFIVYARPIVQLLYQHGAFTSSATHLTAFAVSMYSIGLFAISANLLFQRVFFSFKDTKTPLYITVFAVIFNASGDVLLSRIWGVGGIGFATALTAIIAFFIYSYMIRKKRLVKNFPYRFITKEALKIGISSFFILFVTILLKGFLGSSLPFLKLLIRFSFVSLLLAGIYLLIAYLIKSFGFSVLMTYVKRFLNRLRQKP